MTTQRSCWYRFVIGVPLGIALVMKTAGAPGAATKRDPNALRPSSAKYQGSLSPVVTGLAEAISGNTIVIVQPWVGRKTYELRENPVYFRTDGSADSAQGIDMPWHVDGNNICLLMQRKYCYAAYTDEVGQAYIEDLESGLIGRVTSIEPGDSHSVRTKFIARAQQQMAEQAVQLMFFGLLFESMLGGGGGGGGSCPAGYADVGGGQCVRETETTQPREEYAAPPPPIDPFYGDCHNPTGC